MLFSEFVWFTSFTLLLRMLLNHNISFWPTLLMSAGAGLGAAYALYRFMNGKREFIRPSTLPGHVLAAGKTVVLAFGTGFAVVLLGQAFNIGEVAINFFSSGVAMFYCHAYFLAIRKKPVENT